MTNIIYKLPITKYPKSIELRPDVPSVACIRAEIGRIKGTMVKNKISGENANSPHSFIT
jgi:hypothetical protein